MYTAATPSISFPPVRPPLILLTSHQQLIRLLLLKPQHSHTFDMRCLWEKVEPPQTLYCILPSFHCFFFSLTRLTTLVTFMDKIPHIPRLSVYVT